jgi:hypothetical protein
MKKMTTAVALASGLALSSLASATVFFTFDDPSTALEVTYTQGNAGGPGTMTYSAAPTVDLVVDGTQNGLGIVTYSTILSMNLTIGTATSFGGIFQAPVLAGSFTFSVGGNAILTGMINNGAMLTFGSTGSVVATSSNNSLTLVATDALLGQLALGGYTGLGPVFDSSFSLSNLAPRPINLTQDGYIPSFHANAAFVGNAEPIPSAGSTALAAVAGLFLFPGRRRPQKSGSLFRTVTSHV